MAEEEEEPPEVKVRLVEWPVKAEPEAEEDVKIRLVEGPGGDAAAGAAAGGGNRRRAKREREEEGGYAAGPSGRVGGGQRGRSDGRGASSRFRGVTKKEGRRAKPWMAQIQVTEDGKGRQIYIARFAREEDAARSYDRVNIAKLGHAEAKTNFPVAGYREEWAELEALGVDKAAARERQSGKQQK